MKPLLLSLIPDERDFYESFDQTEILLAIKAKTSREDALAAVDMPHGYNCKSDYRVPGGRLAAGYSE